MRSTSCGFDDSAGVTGRELLVQNGPTLLVDIGFDPTYRTDGTSGPPNLAMKDVRALVDTGATQSCIDSELAMTLALPIVDQAKVSGVSGEMVVNMHLAHIFIPSLPFTVYGAFAAVDLAAGGQTHLALIGRTFLRHFRMTYNGLTGAVIISDGDPAQHEMLKTDS